MRRFNLTLGLSFTALLIACTGEDASPRSTTALKTESRAVKAPKKEAFPREKGLAAYFPDHNPERRGFTQKYRTVLVLRGVKSAKAQYTLNYEEFLSLGQTSPIFDGKSYILRRCRSSSHRSLLRFRTGQYFETFYTHMGEAGIFIRLNHLKPDQLYLPFPLKLGKEWKVAWELPLARVESTGIATMVDSLTVNGRTYSKVLKIVYKDYYPKERLKTTATRTVYRTKGLGMIKRVIDRQEGFLVTTTIVDSSNGKPR